MDCTIAWVLQTVSAFTLECTIGGGMWGGCSLQGPSVRLEARPGGMRTPSVSLPGMDAGQATPVGCTPSYSHLALGLPSLGRLGCLPMCWDDPAYTWRIGSCLSAWHTPAHMWCLGCLTGGQAHLSAHVALGLPAWGLGTYQRTSGAWAALGVTHSRAPRGMVTASGPTMNGSSVRTQLLLGSPSRPKVLGPRILNIIICFRNIIIFIIINIINKIINFCQRKYQY